MVNDAGLEGHRMCWMRHSYTAPLFSVAQWLECFFVSQTQQMRVEVRSRGQQGQQQQMAQGSRERDVDRADPEEFMDNLDGMAMAVFNHVTQEVYVSHSSQG